MALIQHYIFSYCYLFTKTPEITMIYQSMKTYLFILPQSKPSVYKQTENWITFTEGIILSIPITD